MFHHPRNYGRVGWVESLAYAAAIAAALLLGSSFKVYNVLAAPPPDSNDFVFR